MGVIIIIIIIAASRQRTTDELAFHMPLNIHIHTHQNHQWRKKKTIAGDEEARNNRSRAIAPTLPPRWLLGHGNDHWPLQWLSWPVTVMNFFNDSRDLNSYSFVISYILSSCTNTRSSGCPVYVYTFEESI